jgi:hypothetical protein
MAGLVFSDGNVPNRNFNIFTIKPIKQPTTAPSHGTLGVILKRPKFNDNNRQFKILKEGTSKPKTT